MVDLNEQDNSSHADDATPAEAAGRNPGRNQRRFRVDPPHAPLDEPLDRLKNSKLAVLTHVQLKKDDVQALEKVSRDLGQPASAAGNALGGQGCVVIVVEDQHMQEAVDPQGMTPEQISGAKNAARRCQLAAREAGGPGVVVVHGAHLADFFRRHLTDFRPDQLRRFLFGGGQTFKYDGSKMLYALVQLAVANDSIPFIRCDADVSACPEAILAIVVAWQEAHPE